MRKTIAIVGVWFVCGVVSVIGNSDDPLLAALMGTVVLAFVNFGD